MHGAAALGCRVAQLRRRLWRQGQRQLPAPQTAAARCRRRSRGCPPARPRGCYRRHGLGAAAAAGWLCPQAAAGSEHVHACVHVAGMSQGRNESRNESWWEYASTLARLGRQGCAVVERGGRKP
eukprot:365963-Chlamydomonas_euryale.AAC.1